VRGSLGAVLDGTLTDGMDTHDLGPGIVGGVAVSRPWSFGAFFVIGSAGFSASRATTPVAPLVGTDVRVGAVAGRRFGPVSPYLLARAFGGPVMWNDLTGSDATHVQLGAGASVTTASGLSFLVDVSALGERSASLGVSLRL
jgi:hypothetical protein